jgi:DNA mismatch repair protein MutH
MVGYTVPPQSEAELLIRAESLAGSTIGELAKRLVRPLPLDPKRAKGFTGELVEAFLGATAGSRAEPDFPSLGIELKTLPVGKNGRPTESTFVCSLELSRLADSEWATSRAMSKLRRVLWMPVEGERSIPFSDRHFGSPFLWTPNAAEVALLEADWEMLVGLVSEGRTSEITGHLGTALQVRPKAADSHARRIAFDDEGAPYSEMPRGFYLRAEFTAALLDARFSGRQGPEP